MLFEIRSLQIITQNKFKNESKNRVVLHYILRYVVLSEGRKC